MAYFQIKHDCVSCGEFFIICTESPEDYAVDDIYCPRCSLQGTCISVQETIPGSLMDIIFSESPVTGVGPRVEVFDIARGVASFRLQPNPDTTKAPLEDEECSVRFVLPYRP